MICGMNGKVGWTKKEKTMNAYIKAKNLVNPYSQMFWTVIYKDHQKKTCNPGLFISDLSVYEEIKAITKEMRKEGRDVYVMRTGEYLDMKDMPMVGEQLCGLRKMGFLYDPLLMW
jgi:hypothetical protein